MASFPSARSRRYAPGFDATALALGMTLKLNELERHPKRRLSPSLPALTMLTRLLLCSVGGVQVEVRHEDGVFPTLIGRTLTRLSVSPQHLVEFVIAQAPTSSSRQLLLPAWAIGRTRARTTSRFRNADHQQYGINVSAALLPTSSHLSSGPGWQRYEDCTRACCAHMSTDANAQMYPRAMCHA